MSVMSDPKHPIWKILRLGVICITATIMLHINYINGLQPKDLGTIVGILASTGLFDYIKTTLTNKPTES